MPLFAIKVVKVMYSNIQILTDTISLWDYSCLSVVLLFWWRQYLHWLFNWSHMFVNEHESQTWEARGILISLASSSSQSYNKRLDIRLMRFLALQTVMTIVKYINTVTIRSTRCTIEFLAQRVTVCLSSSCVIWELNL